MTKNKRKIKVRRPAPVMQFEGESNFVVKQRGSADEFLYADAPPEDGGIATPPSATPTPPATTPPAEPTTGTTTTPPPSNTAAPETVPNTTTTADQTNPLTDGMGLILRLKASESQDVLCGGGGQTIFCDIVGADFCSATAATNAYFAGKASGTTVYLGINDMYRAVTCNGTITASFIMPCTTCLVTPKTKAEEEALAAQSTIDALESSTIDLACSTAAKASSIEAIIDTKSFCTATTAKNGWFTSKASGYMGFLSHNGMVRSFITDGTDKVRLVSECQACPNKTPTTTEETKETTVILPPVVSPSIGGFGGGFGGAPSDEEGAGDTDITNVSQKNYSWLLWALIIAGLVILGRKSSKD